MVGDYGLSGCSGEDPFVNCPASSRCPERNRPRPL